MGKRAVSPGELDKVCKLLQRFVGLVKENAIYNPDHPRLQVGWENYLECCATVRKLPCIENDRLIIALRSERLYLENLPLSEPVQRLKYLRERLERRGYAGFELSLVLDDEKLRTVLTYLARRIDQDEIEPPPPSSFRWLSEQDIEDYESARRRRLMRENLLNKIPELRVNKQHYDRAIRELIRFSERGVEGGSEGLEQVKATANALLEQVRNNARQLLPLVTMPYDDQFTYYHSANVCLLALITARAALDDQAQLERIGQAALMHDVGKADIPKEILYKEGRLTAAEMKVIEEHPVTGAKMLQEFEDMDPLAVGVAFGHHIKDDGHGYPKVSSRFKISPVTALIEVVDIFEALTAQRPYKRALPAAQAFEVLYSMPHMKSMKPYIDLLYRTLGSQPIGTRVRTADGQLGVVCGHDEKNPEAAVVRLVEKSAKGVKFDTRVLGVRPETGELNSGEGDLETTYVTPLDPDEDMAELSSLAAQ